jgi:hypothetical protein
MPKAFSACVRAGGRIRTVKPQGRCSPLYIPVCWRHGKSVAGEPKYVRTLPKSCRRR